MANGENLNSVEAFIDSMDDDIKEAVDDDLITVFTETLEKQWEEQWTSLPVYARTHNQSVMEDSWRKMEGANILRNLVQKRRDAESRMTTFLKKFEISETMEDVHKELSNLLSKLDMHQVEAFAEYATQSWQRQWKTIPEFARSDEESLRCKWFHDSQTILLDEFKVESDKYRFVPEIAIEQFPSTTQEDARAVFDSVSQQDEKEIETAVEEAFTENISKLPNFMKNTAAEALRKGFLMESYLDIIRSVLEDSKSTKLSTNDNNSSTNTDEKDTLVTHSGEDASPKKRKYSEAEISEIDKKEDGNEAENCVNMFVSPKRRATNENMPARTNPYTVKDFLGIYNETFSSTDTLTVSGYVLHCPDQPRWVSMSNRKTKTSEDVAVLSVLLGDNAGPMILELWRSTADNFLRTIGSVTNDDDKLVGVRVSGCAVRLERNPCFPQMKKLVSMEQTTIEILQPGQGTDLVNSTRDLNGVLYTRGLQPLAKVLPWRASVVGLIASIADSTQASNGVPMQSFTLQDNSGLYVSCIAYGRHVGNPLLACKNEVILFFARGVPGLGGNSPGQLWMYDDSHIVLLRNHFSLPAARTQIEMR